MNAGLKEILNVAYEGEFDELRKIYVLAAHRYERWLESKPGPHICVDIGAHKGGVSGWMAQTARHVLAVEPSATNIERLRKVADVMGNISVYPVGVSCGYGHAQLRGVEGSSGQNSILFADTDQFNAIDRISTVPIENVLHIAEAMRRDDERIYLKIDVEGAEFMSLPSLPDGWAIRYNIAACDIEWHAGYDKEARARYFGENITDDHIFQAHMAMERSGLTVINKGECDGEMWEMK